MLVLGFVAMSLRQASLSLVAVMLSALSVGAQFSRRPPTDLQGSWNNGTLTPLERLAEWKDKQVLTPVEAAAYEHGRFNRSTEEFRKLQSDATYTWLEPLVMDRRHTSLIVDPPNGRLPALLPAGQARKAARGQRS